MTQSKTKLPEGKIVGVQVGKVTRPHVTCSSKIDVPEGENWKFVAPNGVTYEGKVLETVTAGKETLVAFYEAGLKPIDR